MNFKLIGAAIDACAGSRGSADTPDRLVIALKDIGLAFSEVFRYTGSRHELAKLGPYFTQLAISTKAALQNSQFPIVVGGDHSCAIGSWSGIAHALAQKGERLGLIWLDAHMDAHTPATTITGNIHGMPVASLLGYGYTELTSILQDNPKLNPKDIILIGIRSFEDEEAKLLAQLGVKVYYNYEIKQQGFKQIFHQAWAKLAQSVDKIGLSIDLDGFDPEFTPGVGTPEPDGINFNHCLKELAQLNLTKLVGVEITEGNDHFDPSGKTMQCIVDIINTIIKLV
jgi:arginase